MMQHQLERSPRAQRERRSWGELLASWLLVLWGVGTFVFIYGNVNEPNHGGRGLEFYILAVLALLQAVLCFLGGLSSLLRYRTIARWGLYFASFTMAVFSVLFLDDVLQDHLRDVMGIAFGMSLLFFAGSLVFLGRWLGPQEEVVR